MMDPPPLSIIPRAAAMEPKKGPLRMVETTSSKSSSVTSKKGPKRVRAALLTRTSRCPKRRQTASTMPSKSFLEPMSAWKRSASPPASDTWRVVCSAPSGSVLKLTATRAPWAPSPTARPWPMPLLAPVIRATLPPSLLPMGFLLERLHPETVVATSRRFRAISRRRPLQPRGGYIRRPRRTPARWPGAR